MSLIDWSRGGVPRVRAAAQHSQCGPGLPLESLGHFNQIHRDSMKWDVCGINWVSQEMPRVRLAWDFLGFSYFS